MDDQQHLIPLDGTVGSVIQDVLEDPHGAAHGFPDLDEVTSMAGGSHHLLPAQFHPGRGEPPPYHFTSQPPSTAFANPPPQHPAHRLPMSTMTQVLPPLGGVGSPNIAPGSVAQAYMAPQSPPDSSPSSPTRSSKKKRKRQMKTPAQLALLEKEFAISPLPNKETRYAIANAINLTPRQVQIWFQNKRAKVKNQRRKLNPNFSFQHPGVGGVGVPGPGVSPQNVSKELQQLIQNAPLLDPHTLSLSALASEAGGYPDPTNGTPPGAAPNILDLGEGKKISTRSGMPMNDEKEMENMRRRSSSLDGGMMNRSDDREDEITRRSVPALEQDTIDAVRYRVQQLCKKTRKVITNGNSPAKVDSEVDAAAEQLLTEITMMRNKIAPFFIYAAQLDGAPTPKPAKKRIKLEASEEKQVHSKMEIDEDENGDESFIDEDNDEGEGWCVPCFKLLQAFTEQYAKLFTGEDFRESIYRAQEKVGTALFALWKDVLYSFEPHLSLETLEKWIGEAVSMDHSAMLELTGHPRGLGEIEMKKRIEELQQTNDLQIYQSLIKRAAAAGKQNELKNLFLNALSFEGKVAIGLAEEMYDDVVKEVSGHPSSGFLRVRVIGQNNRGTNGKKVLVLARPEYVLERAKIELERETEKLIERVRRRLQKGDELKEAYESLTPKAKSAKVEEFQKALEKSLNEDENSNGRKAENGEDGVEDMVSSEARSLDFRWQEDEERPAKDYYLGLEGWLICARIAGQVLEQTEEQSKFEELCKELEIKVKTEIKEDAVWKAHHKALLDADVWSERWKPLVQFIQRASNGDLMGKVGK